MILKVAANAVWTCLGPSKIEACSCIGVKVVVHVWSGTCSGSKLCYHVGLQTLHAFMVLFVAILDIQMAEIILTPRMLLFLSLQPSTLAHMIIHDSHVYTLGTHDMSFVILCIGA